MELAEGAIVKWAYEATTVQRGDRRADRDAASDSLWNGDMCGRKSGRSSITYFASAFVDR